MTKMLQKTSVPANIKLVRQPEPSVCSCLPHQSANKVACGFYKKIVQKYRTFGPRFPGNSLFIFVGIICLAVSAIGCKDDITSAGDPGEQEVQVLPPFDDSFVPNKQTAYSLAVRAQTEIENAANDIIVNLPDGPHSKDGITVDYSSTSSETSPSTFPQSHNVVFEVTLQNAERNGYKITGKYNERYEENYTSEEEFTAKSEYNYVYTVSNNKQGMKVIQTGKMTAASNGAGSYDMYYTVYDNNNIKRYSFSVQF